MCFQPVISPRRLRAKYTPRTNLRFVLSVFRPCGEPPYRRLQEAPAASGTALFQTLSASETVATGKPVAK